MTVDPGGATPMSERMQSLLSRAVEDQLSEQRQLAGVLADVRGQLQRIATDVAELRGERATGTSVDASEAMLASVSADVREAVRLLAERLDGVARLVQQRGQDLAELRAVTGDLQTSVRAQAEGLAGVSAGLGALPAFGERIGGLQDNLAALHERLSALDEMSGTAGAMQQRVEHLAQELRDLRSAFAGIGARIAELPGRSDLEASAARSSEPLADAAQRLRQVEAALPGLSTQIAALGDELRERPEPVADVVTGRLDDLASALADETQALRGRLDTIEHRVADVLAAVTPHEDEPDDSAPAEQAEDPVLAELGELWEALFGDEGLAAKVEAATNHDLDARVTEVVGQAVSAAEARLTAHIDEAVLALAEALLRRRTTRSSSPRAVVPAEPVTVAATPGPAAAQEADDTDAEEASDDGSPWQTPPATRAADGPTEDADRRRRPWWRPGD